MGMRNRYKRHTDGVTNTKRWKALRLEALRRDGFQCVQCGARGRLECDHVVPVRQAAERAFDLTNLQILCPACHGRKTRLEIGHPELPAPRKAWRALVAATAKPPEQMEN